MSVPAVLAAPPVATFLPWLLLGAAVFIFLFVVAVGVPRLRAAPTATATAPAPPPAAPAEHAATRDLAVVLFDGLGAAERAYGNVRDGAPHASWLPDVAFAERHRHDHLVVRGTFAGRYLDIGDAGDHEPVPTGALFDELRESVPEGCSALVVYAPTDEVDAVEEAFGDAGVRFSRHRVTGEEAEALEASVASAPPAAHGPA
jgi:hypothetical protein